VVVALVYEVHQGEVAVLKSVLKVARSLVVAPLQVVLLRRSP